MAKSRISRSRKSDLVLSSPRNVNISMLYFLPCTKQLRKRETSERDRVVCFVQQSKSWPHSSSMIYSFGRYVEVASVIRQMLLLLLLHFFVPATQIYFFSCRGRRRFQLSAKTVGISISGVCKAVRKVQQVPNWWEAEIFLFLPRDFLSLPQNFERQAVKKSWLLLGCFYMYFVR